MEGVDMDTSFFSLGGDIVALAQLAYLFPAEHQQEVSLRLEELLENPTLCGHVAVLAARGISIPPSPTVEEGVEEGSKGRKTKKAATFPISAKVNAKGSQPAEEKVKRVDSALSLKVAGKALRLVTKRLGKVEKRKRGDAAQVVVR
jgi:hypothetical protein